MSFVMEGIDPTPVEGGPSNSGSKANAHVGIVGAGMAGLRCAEVLLEQGHKVTILEARKRIGGRIHQSDEIGFKLDLGANWIHTFGTGTNPILAIAKETKTPLNLWHNENHFYDSTGNKLSQERGDQLFDLVSEIFDEAFAYSAKQTDSISEDKSVYEFVVEKLKDVAAKYNEDPEVLMTFADTWSGYVGQSIKEQSLKFAYLDECCGEEQYFVEGTYKPIIERVAKSALKNADIQLGHKVIAIETREEDSEVVKVKTENGECYEFTEVVMTAPLGWLKRNTSIFTPSLPPRLTQAIDAIGVANLEKICISFPRAFWLDTTTSDPAPNPFTGFTEWLAPTYAPNTNPQSFQMEAWSLASSPNPQSHHPAILFYVNGQCSTYLTDTIRSLPTNQKPSSHHYRSNSPSRLATPRYAFLSNFFEPYFSRLPGYRSDDDTCKPLRIVATDWTHDELAGWGSFCNFKIGAKDAERDVQVLREGLGHRGLWFAGEHAAPVGELGTVAGAWLSGEEAARRIVEKHGGSKKDED